MSYIGAEPTTAAFPFDQFTGNGTTTSFTLTYAPASATSIVVAISGVVQNPNLYSVVGTTLTFSPAPPTGTNNIAVLYLGLPVIGSSSPGNTAFLSSTDLTATAGQTVFASAGSYTPGFVQVFRNGARLGNADFTATNGTTITLASAATAGDLVTIEYYTLTSLTNALPLTGGTVTGSTTFNSAVTINGAAVSGFTGMKNRIINGNMVVDQRNAGALQTGIGNNTFIADRFSYQRAGLGITAVFNCQQSTTAPTGYGNSAYLTATTGQTLGASGGAYMMYRHVIEGFNIADALRSQSSVTISFWTYFSNSGTYSLVATNAVDRSYATTYTVTAANTWQQITLTIPLTASGGTWNYTNGIGLELRFTLDAHDDVCTASNNAWVSTNSYGASGQTHGKVTTGATFYITGVQLERGSNATSFEFIDYGRQLIQCYRYFISYGGVTSYERLATGTCSSATAAPCITFLPVEMRTAPSLTSSASSTWGLFDGVNVTAVTSITVDQPSTKVINAIYGVASGLTTYRPVTVVANNTTTARLQLSAEL